MKYVIRKMQREDCKEVARIITHCLVNSLSIFNVENTISAYIAPIFLIIVPLVYANYINNHIGA